MTLSKNPDIPLVASYTRETVNDGPVTVRVKGKTEEMDIAHTYETGYGTEFPIFGLYPDFENTVVIIDSNVTFTVSVVTEALPDNTPFPTIVNNLPSVSDLEYNAHNHDLYWVTLLIDSMNEPWKTIAYDRTGSIRYYTAGAQLVRISYSENDKLIKLIRNDISTLSANIIFPEVLMHHDRIELSDGMHVVLNYSEYGDEDSVAVYNSDANLIREMTFGSLFRDVVEKQPDEEIKASDLLKLKKIILDNDNILGDLNNNGINDNNSEPDFGVADWAHANSLLYDSSTEVMYFSLRHQGVIAVDWKNWELLWWMAHEDLHTKNAVPVISGDREMYGELNFHDIESLRPYRVEGAGLTDGPKNQHALFLHKDGNIGMFDNRGDEDINLEGSRYVEYKITGNKSVGLLAEVVKEYYDKNYYSRVVSDIDFTGEGNLLMTWGNNNDPNAKIVLQEVAISDTNSSKVIFQLILDPYIGGYRADKMPLYPYSDVEKKYSMDNNAKDVQ